MKIDTRHKCLQIRNNSNQSIQLSRDNMLKIIRELHRENNKLEIRVNKQQQMIDTLRRKLQIYRGY